VLISWPLERWTLLDSYQSSFIGVEPQSAPGERPLPVGVPA
jgi:signal peptidase I